MEATKLRLRSVWYLRVKLLREGDTGRRGRERRGRAEWERMPGAGASSPRGEISRQTWGRVKDSRGEINWIGGGRERENADGEEGGRDEGEEEEDESREATPAERTRRGTHVLLPPPGAEGKHPPRRKPTCGPTHACACACVCVSCSCEVPCSRWWPFHGRRTPFSSFLSARSSH